MMSSDGNEKDAESLFYMIRHAYWIVGEQRRVMKVVFTGMEMQNELSADRAGSGKS